MMTTYQLRSDELNYELIDSIKNTYKNKNIVIDVYQNEEIDLVLNEITNPEIIKRINDIKVNKNIVISPGLITGCLRKTRGPFAEQSSLR